jgi:hypothetical protein
MLSRPLALFACVASLLSPLLARAAGEWVTLFNGTSLEGWKAAETPDAFSVVDGTLKVLGKRGHLFYLGQDGKAAWTDFELEMEVKTSPGANSGVFIHTGWQESGWPAKGYECQVNCSQGDSIKTASLYNVVKVNPAPHADDEWFTYHISVQGKRVVTKVNGKVIVDYTEKPEDIKGERKLSSGTVAIQAHDPKSLVHYRNIRIRSL